jgi:hypothetical protein
MYHGTIMNYSQHGTNQYMAVHKATIKSSAVYSNSIIDPLLHHAVLPSKGNTVLYFYFIMTPCTTVHKMQNTGVA